MVRVALSSGLGWQEFDLFGLEEAQLRKARRKWRAVQAQGDPIDRHHASRDVAGRILDELGVKLTCDFDRIIAATAVTCRPGSIRYLKENNDE